MKSDWQQHWNPKAYWKDTADFRAYRDDLVAKTLQLVAEWKQQRSGIGRANKNMAFLCSRLELLVDECDPTDLPSARGQGVQELADDLADYPSILPATDCWTAHGNSSASPGEDPPTICDGCPLIGPVKGMSGDRRYWACDALSFIGEKLVEWRVGLPANPWPEPGVWYSAFESDRGRH